MNQQIDFLDPLRDLPAFVASCRGRAYTGIGSRETPDDVCLLMTAIAKRLETEGLVLRSGAAKKADEAFDTGTSRSEIFIPWPNFAERCGRRSPLLPGPNVFISSRLTTTAYNMAARNHPKFYNLSEGKQRLHARSSYQVMGKTCADPSAFVLCWTPDGSTSKTYSRTGGTGQAIRIAYAHGIPIFNLQRDDHREAWEAFVESR
jgi:hypothetical protein